MPTAIDFLMAKRGVGATAMRRHGGPGEGFCLTLPPPGSKTLP